MRRNLCAQDFHTVSDDLLIALAGWTNSIERNWVDVDECMRAHRMPFLAPTELEAILDGYVAEGFGSISKADKDEFEFLISMKGLREAKAKAKARQPLSMEERLRQMSRSDWIALGALITSIVALFT